MRYDESAIDRKVRLFLEANTWAQQFGQSNDEAAWDGKTACTHVIWQLIALLWTGRKYSINQINYYAGTPEKAMSGGVIRGMRVSESEQLVDRLNLPYKLELDLTWSQLQAYQQKAPIYYPTRYGSQPDKRYFVYKGTTADGSPNGFARRNGRTQLTGFENGRHAVMGALARKVFTDAGAYARTEQVRKDPNHGSSSRPERPAYDIISIGQATREYGDYRDALGNRLFAFVPTKELSA